MEHHEKRLHEYLREAAAQKGVGAENLANLTHIQLRYVEALLDGRYQDLPPAPYVRGYLARIGGILNLDAELLLRLFAEAASFRTSGTHDRLPANRFALRTGQRRLLLAGVILFLVAGYGVLRFDALIGHPMLRVDAPASGTVLAATPVFTVRGIANPNDKVTVNGDEAPIDPTTGAFEKDVALQQGVNTVHVIAKRFLGRTAEEVRQIVYQPELPAESVSPIQSEERILVPNPTVPPESDASGF